MNKNIYSLPVTQYILPNGKTKNLEVCIQGYESQLAEKLVLAGYIFEAEILNIGLVSITCIHPESEDGEPCGHVISKNDIQIDEKMKQLIRSSYKHLEEKS